MLLWVSITFSHQECHNYGFHCMVWKMALGNNHPNWFETMTISKLSLPLQHYLGNAKYLVPSWSSKLFPMVNMLSHIHLQQRPQHLNQPGHSQHLTKNTYLSLECVNALFHFFLHFIPCFSFHFLFHSFLHPRN